VLNNGDIKKRWNGTRINHDKKFPTDVMEYQNGYRGKKKAWHPQALPIALVRFFITLLSHETDTILDPFMGSGTTAVACKELGRQYIGIEVNPKYHKMAEDRVNGLI
jgi:DNA modification methylase